MFHSNAGYSRNSYTSAAVIDEIIAQVSYVAVGAYLHCVIFVMSRPIQWA